MELLFVITVVFVKEKREHAKTYLSPATLLALMKHTTPQSSRVSAPDFPSQNVISRDFQKKKLRPKTNVTKVVG